MNIKLMKWIDEYIFKILVNILGFKPIYNYPKLKKILIIKTWAIGDSVCLLPLIKILKENIKGVQIDVLAHEQNRAVFDGQKYINKVIQFGTFNIIKLCGQYDLCIDAEPFLNISALIAYWSAKYTIGFSHGTRARIYSNTIYYNKEQHIIQTYLDFARLIGIKCNTNKLVSLEIDKKSKDDADVYLRDMEVKKSDFLVGICPGVGGSVKERAWSDRRMAELADKIIQSGKKVMFIDSNPVNEIYNKMHEVRFIDASQWFKLKASAQLLKRCNVVVSNDSGMMHVAAAMGTKTIGLFGPNTPKIWAPYGKGNISIFKPKKDCPYLDNITHQLTPKNLTEEQLTCMDAIEVQDVYRKI
jgi:heptosyltransferase-2